MGYLQCNNCNRTIWSDNYIEAGLPCKISGCSGVMAFIGGYIVSSAPKVRLDLQCTDCGHICSSVASGKGLFSKCPVKGCNGLLNSYYRY
jgi:hypothetical protein